MKARDLLGAWPARSQALAAIAILLLAGGCHYDDDKALRSYDAALAPVRIEMLEIIREQPRLAERGSPARLRDELVSGFIPHVRRMIDDLAAISPDHPSLDELHSDLVALWREYQSAFVELAEDLSEETMGRKRAQAGRALVRLRERFDAWEARARALEAEITSWKS